MKRFAVWFSLLLALTACGYRAPMSETVVTEDPENYPEIRPEYRPLAALITSDTKLPPVGGNAVELLPEGQQKLDGILRDFAAAQSSIYIDHYRICSDSSGTIVMNLLKEKAAQGVDVRIIVDKPANTEEDRAILLGLNEAGIKADLFHFPSWPLDYLWPSKAMHRDHRKIITVDGIIGYTGGRNIQDEYFFEWRDADVRIEGPAVEQLNCVYQENQQRVNPDLPPLRPAIADTVVRGNKIVQIVPDSPDDTKLPIRNLFEWAIGNAKDYFYFYNPYTPPPSSTIDLLKEAAARGVDVRWIVPANNDVSPAKWMGESLYGEFLRAGIRVYEWQGNVLHAKQFISDDYLTAVGSANMDNLSFFLNYEALALVYDEEVATEAHDLYLEELDTRCKELTLEEVKKWSIFKKLWVWLAKSALGSIT